MHQYESMFVADFIVVDNGVDVVGSAWCCCLMVSLVVDVRCVVVCLWFVYLCVVVAVPV